MHRLERWIKNNKDYSFQIFKQALEKRAKEAPPSFKKEPCLFIFKERFLNERKFADIAKEMGVHNSTAHARKRQSLSILRRYLRDSEDYKFIHDNIFW